VNDGQLIFLSFEPANCQQESEMRANYAVNDLFTFLYPQSIKMFD